MSLDIWTVYDHPTDYPDYYVARRFVLDRPTGQVFTAVRLEDLRDALAQCGLHCLPRDPRDDPVIVEVWI